MRDYYLELAKYWPYAPYGHRVAINARKNVKREIRSLDNSRIALNLEEKSMEKVRYKTNARCTNVCVGKSIRVTVPNPIFIYNGKPLV